MNNYAFTRGNDLPVIEDGHVFEYVNFTQAQPHTKIFEGVTGLTFRKCNLMNCDVPVGAIVEDCLRIHKSLCANLHPRWVKKGLAECVENCSHVTEIDVITIDGVKVDTVYHRKDTLEVI